MPKRSPRRGQANAAPVVTRNGPRRTPATSRCRVTPVPPPRRARQAGVLPRPSSEPALWTMRFASEGNDARKDDDDDDDDDDDNSGVLQILPRHHTCMDIRPPGLLLSPSPPRPTEERGSSGRKLEGKVVVTVAVEGSPGPVRAMVRLGASVEEAIGAVVDAYGREGRSPRLDPAAVASFQLHHNHFCLQSLNKANTLGEVGGRSFYLRRNCGTTAGCSSADGGNGGAGAAGKEIPPAPLVLLSTHRFLAIVVARLSKIGRKLGKLCRAFGCAPCG